jgi:hypothetical protein
MRARLLLQGVPVVALATMLVIGVNGCKKDDETTNPPQGFSSNPSAFTLAPSDSGTATISGGTTPYTIESGPDTIIATASLSGSTLSVKTVVSGYTSVLIKDAANATLRVGINVTGAITYTIFPLVNGHSYVYAGYATNTSSNGGGRLPDPNNIYRTRWSLIGPLPGPIPPAGSFSIQDSTTLHLGTTDTTVTRTLVIIPNPVTGTFTFFQTLGPFFRALGITPPGGPTDTVRAVTIVDPRVGIGGTWTPFDSTYTNAQSSTVRLQIIGTLEGGDQITDSSAQRTTRDALRFVTRRNIWVGSSQVVSNAITARIWLSRDIGPVQVHIAEDTENIGHFRVMKEKSF